MIWNSITIFLWTNEIFSLDKVWTFKFCPLTMSKRNDNSVAMGKHKSPHFRTEFSLSIKRKKGALGKMSNFRSENIQKDLDILYQKPGNISNITTVVLKKRHKCKQAPIGQSGAIWE